MILCSLHFPSKGQDPLLRQLHVLIACTGAFDDFVVRDNGFYIVHTAIAEFENSVQRI